MDDNPKRHIAVIDDDPGVRASVARLLGLLGCYVESFASAEAFLDTVPASKASCLIVDIHLGDISGIELVRQLSAEGFTFPVIFITALPEDHIRRQVEETGCVALLGKPFDTEALVDAINLATDWKITARHRAVDQR